LRRKGQAHGDVKPANYVIKDDHGLAFIDFAHMDPPTKEVYQPKGTLPWSPPEVLRTYENWQRYLKAQIPPKNPNFVPFSYEVGHADTYALGITLFWIFY